MPETKTPIELKGMSIAELEQALAQRRRPPVASWDPPYCGDSGMRIGRDGTWHHDGRPILRPQMVRLFATILRREPDGSHVLVTPVEKLGIEVESTPLRAIGMESEGSGKARRIAFSIDDGDAVVLDLEHPLRLVEDENGPSPRVEVRNGLEAELSRPVYYELAEMALAEGSNPPGIWSSGSFFPLVPTE